jgi:hypothetical protein
MENNSESKKRIKLSQIPIVEKQGNQFSIVEKKDNVNSSNIISIDSDLTYVSYIYRGNQFHAKLKVGISTEIEYLRNVVAKLVKCDPSEIKELQIEAQGEQYDGFKRQIEKHQ